MSDLLDGVLGALPHNGDWAPIGALPAVQSRGVFEAADRGLIEADDWDYPKRVRLTERGVEARTAMEHAIHGDFS